MSESATVSPYLTTEELAGLLRTTPGAVQKMRHRRQGPRGARVGRRVLYLRADVERWMAARLDCDSPQRAA